MQETLNGLNRFYFFIGGLNTKPEKIRENVKFPIEELFLRKRNPAFYAGLVFLCIILKILRLYP